MSILSPAYTFCKRHKNIIIATVIFGVLAAIAYLPEYPLDPNQLPNCGCGDVSQSVWFLSWSPFALFHGMNPFTSNWLNYPVGSNLAISANYFLYAIILSPITYLLNAVATYNLLLWLSFVLSAVAMYYVVSKISNKFLPAFFAGLFYGFSPYMVSEGTGHLNLIFIPCPPLIFYVLYKMFCTDTLHRYRLGVVLAALVIFQYMMSSEVLATTAIMALLGGVILVLTHPRESIGRVKKSLPSLFLAAVISGIALAYPVYYSIAGPNHINVIIHAWHNQFHADLLGILIPNQGQLLYPQSWKSLGTSFLAGDWIENGSYLGIPLLLGLVIGGCRIRKNKWVQFSAVMAFFAWVLSLGPYLTVDNKTYPIPLPFDLFQHLSILNNILPSRIAMYSDLFLAIIIGFIIDDILHSFPLLKRTKKASLEKDLSKKIYNKVAISIASVSVILLALLPNWPYQLSYGELPNTYSKFFTTKDVSYIPNQAVTLTYPYPIMADNEAMVWQSFARMRFRLLGGYNLFTIPPGYPSGFPSVLSPSGVESAFSYFADQNTFPLVAAPQRSVLHQIKTFVIQNHVQAILVNMDMPNANLVTSNIEKSFGLPKVYQYGIKLWVIKK